MRVHFTATQLIDFVKASNHLGNNAADVRSIPNPIPGSRFFHLANDRYTIKVPRAQRDLTLVDDENTLSLGFLNASDRIASILTARSSTDLASRLLVDPRNTPQDIEARLHDHLVLGTTDGRLVGFQRLAATSVPDFLKGVHLFERRFDTASESAATLLDRSEFQAFAESIRFSLYLKEDQDIEAISRTAHLESLPDGKN